MTFIPKFHKLRETLQKEIDDGKPGDRLPSVRAMMAKYRVSQSAIERSLDDLVRQNLVRRVRGSGTYIVGEVPRNSIVGIYTDSEVAVHSNALFIQGVRTVAESHGFEVADFGPRNIFEKRESTLKMLNSLSPAGIITAFSTASNFRLESDLLLNAFRQLHAPVVTCLPIAALPADAVMPDHFEAFERLGQGLRPHIASPVKFLGHIGIPSLARLHGLRVGLGPEVQVETELIDQFSGKDVYDRLKQLVKDGVEGNLVVGVQPGNAGMIDALRDAPWRKGSRFQLSITLEEGDLLPANVVANVVLRPSRQLGAAAAEMLLRRIRGFRGEPQRKIVRHQILYASTGIS